MKNNKFIKRISALSILGVLGLSVLSGSLNTFAANNYIGVEKAKSIALKDAGVSGATFVKAKLDSEDGVKVYDVEFYKANVEYDYEIDAITGKILEKDRDIENYTIPKKKATTKKQTTKKQTTTKAKSKSKAKTSTKKVAKDIGVEKAKSIALKDAGVSGATFVKAKLDSEDGVKVYDVEFYKANVEYDYEIDAITGKILEKDRDIENYTIPKKKATTNKQTTKKQTTTKAKSKAKTSSKKVAKDIGVEKAKSIALKDAGVSGVKFTKAKVDHENGVKVYDIEFRKGNKEYDYEIEAATGKIRERNVDLDD